VKEVVAVSDCWLAIWLMKRKCVISNDDNIGRKENREEKKRLKAGRGHIQKRIEILANEVMSMKKISLNEKNVNTVNAEK